MIGFGPAVSGVDGIERDNCPSQVARGSGRRGGSSGYFNAVAINTYSVSAGDLSSFTGFGHAVHCHTAFFDSYFSHPSRLCQVKQLKQGGQGDKLGFNGKCFHGAKVMKKRLMVNLFLHYPAPGNIYFVLYSESGLKGYNGFSAIVINRYFYTGLILF